MKKILSLIAFLGFGASLWAQDIDYKKDQVFVDNVAKFNFDRRHASTLFSLYKLDTKDEIIFMSLQNIGSTATGAKYIKLVFIGKDVTVETESLVGVSWKKIIKMLLEEKVLDLDGNINMERLKIFAEKYDN